MQATGYAIIQYETTDAKEAAIQNENKSRLLNKKITVRPAVIRTDNQPNQVIDTPPRLYPFTISNSALPVYPICHTFHHNLTIYDVEIITLTKEVTQYAEDIERNIKDMGISVNIMYLKKQNKLLQLLQLIKDNGTILAIIIAQNNMENKTVDVQLMNNLNYYRTLPLKITLRNLEDKVRSMRNFDGRKTL